MHMHTSLFLLLGYYLLNLIAILIVWNHEEQEVTLDDLILALFVAGFVMIPIILYATYNVYRNEVLLDFSKDEEDDGDLDDDFDEEYYDVDDFNVSHDVLFDDDAYDEEDECECHLCSDPFEPALPTVVVADTVTVKGLDIKVMTYILPLTGHYVVYAYENVAIMGQGVSLTTAKYDFYLNYKKFMDDHGFISVDAICQEPQEV